MRLDHSFMVPVPVHEAWSVLIDVPRIAPCMPGASLDEVDGDEFRGRVRIKAGPITVAYQGTARLAEADVDARRAVIHASGKEQRGSGSVKATITANLIEAGPQTRVDVVTELAITGKPAQLGRGLMEDIGGKIIDQFAGRLAEELGRHPLGPAVAETTEAVASPPEPGTSAGAAAGTTSARQPQSPQASTRAPFAAQPEPVAINLFSTVGPALLKRGGALAAAVVVAAVVVWWATR